MSAHLAEEGLRAILKGLPRHPEPINQEHLEERHRQSLLPGAREATQAAFDYGKRLRSDPNQAQRFDLRHRLPHLRIPTLFIWGRHDRLAEPRLAIELERLLPNIRFIYFEDSGHQLQNDEPEHFNQVAAEFSFGK